MRREGEGLLDMVSRMTYAWALMRHAAGLPNILPEGMAANLPPERARELAQEMWPGAPEARGTGPALPWGR